MRERTRSARWTALVLVAAMSLVVTPVAWSQATRVAQVDVTGNERINKEAILATVTTKPGDELSNAKLEADVVAIRAMGWFRAVAPPRVEDTPAGKKVTFVVTEWPVVQRIEFTGNKSIDEAALREVMATKENQVFNTPVLESDIQKIEELYKQRGFVGRVTEGVGEKFPETGVLTIPVVEAVVDTVRVQGNRKTREYVIRRELTLKPGEPFNVNALHRDYRRLERLDIFETIDARPTPTDPGKVALTWDVKEKRTGQVSVGLGYSARQNLVGRIELAETNFRGRGQGVNLQYEIGRFSGGGSVDLGFYEPWLDKRRTSLSVNVFNKLIYRFSTRFRSAQTDESERYNERRKGGALTLSRPFSETFRGSLGLRHEQVTMDAVPLGSSFFSQEGPVTSTTIRGIQDTRNFATNPTSGSYATSSIEIGTVDVTETIRATDDSVSRREISGALGKYVLDYRRYFGLKRHRATSPLERQRERIPVLAARFMGGTSSGNLPFFEQFFIGGADTIRGYEEGRFWGKNMFLFSSELRMPVASNLMGVLFVDYGDAWDAQSGLNIENLPQHSSFRGNYGVGIGLRVNTPIGPISLDYGVGREGGQTHFRFGHSF